MGPTFFFAILKRITLLVRAKEDNFDISKTIQIDAYRFDFKEKAVFVGFLPFSCIMKKGLIF